MPNGINFSPDESRLYVADTGGNERTPNPELRKLPAGIHCYEVSKQGKLGKKLFQIEQERQQGEQSEARRSQVGSGERSEKIRTYNFPENRLTDHRVHLTVHRLDKILEGELDEFTEALAAEDRRRALDTTSA